jgi:hypothetical protein
MGISTETILFGIAILTVWIAVVGNTVSLFSYIAAFFARHRLPVRRYPIRLPYYR